MVPLKETKKDRRGKNKMDKRNEIQTISSKILDIFPPIPMRF